MQLAQTCTEKTIISIHALLAESDIGSYSLFAATGISIHALLAESDQAIPAAKPALRYFYPRSPCGERQILFFRHSASIFISIHALLAESDLRFLHVWLAFKTFLSTLSLRRATPGTPHAMSQHL